VIVLGSASLAAAAAIYVWAARLAVRARPNDRLSYGRWSASGTPRRLTVIGLFFLIFGMILVGRDWSTLWIAVAAALLINIAASTVIWLHNHRIDA
jgi:hypothetical protein